MGNGTTAQSETEAFDDEVKTTSTENDGDTEGESDQNGESTTGNVKPEAGWVATAAGTWQPNADNFDARYPSAEFIGLPQLALIGSGAPLLSDEALRTKSGLLREAIKDEDVNEIKRLLEPITADDRLRLIEIYNQQTDPKFHQPWNLERDMVRWLNDGKNPTSEIKHKYAEVTGILNREDSRTNDAAQLQEAISRKSTYEVLETLATLNPNQIADLDADFRAQFGRGYKEAIADAKFLSPEAKKFIEVLNKGLDPEVRTTKDIMDLAMIAAEKQDVGLLAIALRGDIAKEAREELKTSGPFQELLRQPFKDLPDFIDKEKEEFQFGRGQVVKDILNEGHISLATIVDENNHRGFSPMGMFGSDNKGNVNTALDYATDEEKAKYQRGKELSEQGGTAGEGNSQADRDALDFYRRLNKQLNDLGNDRDVVRWEQKLLEGSNQETLDVISALAQNYKDKDNFYRQIDDLSESDWSKLKDPKLGPSLRQQLVASLNKYANQEHTNRVLTILDKKLEEETYEASSDVRRSISDVLRDTHSDDDLVRAIKLLSAEDRQRYRSDAGFRTIVIKAIEEHTDGKDETLIKSMLSRIEKTGEKPELTPAEQVIWDQIFKKMPGQTLRDIEIALQDEQFRKKIREGKELTSVEKAFKDVVNDTLKAGLLITSGLTGGLDLKSDALEARLYRDGKLPLPLQLEVGVPKTYIYENLTNASNEEVEQVKDKLNDKERQIVDAILDPSLPPEKRGKIQVEDKLRSYIIGDGSHYYDFEETLRNLKPEELQHVKSEYARKYKRDLDNDFLDKVRDEDKKDLHRYSHLLNPVDELNDGRQDYYDNLQAQRKSLGVDTGDGTKLTLVRSTQLYGEALQQFQQNYEKLPQEKRDELDKLFQQAIEDYRLSKSAYADRLVTIATIVGGAALTVATGGVAAAALPYFFVAGAAMRVGVKKAIEGNDFDGKLSNILKEGFIGGTTAALSVVGPETVASFAVVGKVAAGRVVGGLSERGFATALKEGSETVIEKRINDIVPRVLVRGEQASRREISSLANEVLVPGASRAQREATEELIASQINRSGKEALEGFLNPRRLLGDAREVVGFSAFAATSNAATEIAIAPVNGGIQFSQLKQSFIMGAAAGGAFALAFKGGATAIGGSREIVANVRTEPGKPGFQFEGPEPATLAVRKADGTSTEIALQPGRYFELNPDDSITHINGVAIDELRVRAEGAPIEASAIDEINTKFEVPAGTASDVMPAALPAGAPVRYMSQDVLLLGVADDGAPLIRTLPNENGAPLAPRLMDQAEVRAQFESISNAGSRVLQDADGKLYTAIALGDKQLVVPTDLLVVRTQPAADALTRVAQDYGLTRVGLPSDPLAQFGFTNANSPRLKQLITEANQPLNLPEATGPSIQAQNSITTTPWKNGTIFTGSDGTVTIFNGIDLTKRSFGRQGRLVQESVELGGLKLEQSYTYGVDGKLEAIRYSKDGDTEKLRVRQGNEWITVFVRDDGTVATQQYPGWDDRTILVSPEGGTLAVDKTGLDHDTVSTRHTIVASDGRTLPIGGDYDYELGVLRRTFELQPDAVRQKAQSLIDELDTHFKAKTTHDTYSRTTLYGISQYAAQNPAKALDALDKANTLLQSTDSIGRVEFAVINGEPVVSIVKTGDGIHETLTSTGKRSLQNHEQAILNFDATGRLTSTYQGPTGFERRFSYAEDGNFKALDDKWPGGKGQLLKKDDNWLYHLERADGTSRTVNVGRGTPTLNEAGALVFQSADPTVASVTLRLDGFIETKLANGRVEVANYDGTTEVQSAVLAQERELLQSNIIGHRAATNSAQMRSALFSEKGILGQVPADEQAVLMSHLNTLFEGDAAHAYKLIRQLQNTSAIDPITSVKISRFRNETYLQLPGATAAMQMRVFKMDAAGNIDLNALPPDLVAGHVDQSGMWQPSRQLNDFSAERRAQMIEHLRTRYAVGDPLMIDTFVKRSTEMVNGWRSTQAPITQAYRAEVRFSSEMNIKLNEHRAAQAQVLSTIGDRPLPEGITRNTLETSASDYISFLKEHGTAYGIDNVDGHVKTTENLVAARESFAQARSATDSLTKVRVEQLQALADETTKSLGLPAVKLEVHDFLGTNVGGNYSSATVRLLRDSVLLTSSPESWTNTLYHELTHFEQDIMVARRFADQMGLGSNATPEQVNDLKKMMQSYANSGLSVETLAEMLRLRNGERLSPKLSEQADALLAAVRENYAFGERLEQSANDFRVLSAQKRTSDPLKLIDGIAKPEAGAPTWIKLLDPDNNVYGELPQPLKEKVSALKSQRQRILSGENAEAIGWDPIDASKTLQELIQERLRQINEFRQADFSRYAAKQHEWDAWLTGELAQDAARRAGIPHADQEMVNLLHTERQDRAQYNPIVIHDKTVPVPPMPPPAPDVVVHPSASTGAILDEVSIRDQLARSAGRSQDEHLSTYQSISNGTTPEQIKFDNFVKELDLTKLSQSDFNMLRAQMPTDSTFRTRFFQEAANRAVNGQPDPLLQMLAKLPQAEHDTLMATLLRDASPTELTSLVTTDSKIANHFVRMSIDLWRKASPVNREIIKRAIIERGRQAALEHLRRLGEVN